MEWGSQTIAGQALAPVMRRFRLLAWLAVSIAALVAQPAAAGKVQANGNASAIVVTRLSFIKTQDLNFGQIAPGSAAGTVTVAPDSTRTKTGNLILAGTSAQAASFSGYGFPGQSVLISLSAPTATLRRQGGTETMQFDTFIIGSNPQVQLSTAPLSFRIGSTTGQFAFSVGATLRVGARQAAGTYAGTFALTLQYQ